jgi:FCD domain
VIGAGISEASLASTTPTGHRAPGADKPPPFPFTPSPIGRPPLSTPPELGWRLHMRAIRRLTIHQDNRAERSIRDHMRIIEALERRDTEAAESLVRQHTLDLAAPVERYGDFLETQ